MSSDDTFSARERRVMSEAREFEHVELQAPDIIGFTTPHCLDPRLMYSLLFARRPEFWRDDLGGFDLIWHGEDDSGGMLSILLCLNDAFAVRCRPGRLYSRIRVAVA